MSESNNNHEAVFSTKVRAGHRTYFFDVKTTKSNDYYLTITESKRRNGDDGNPFYEKHKIFLYHEDFQNFSEAFNESVNRINELCDGEPVAPREKPESPKSSSDNHRPQPITSEEADEHKKSSRKDSPPASSFTDVSFDDLK